MRRNLLLYSAIACIILSGCATTRRVGGGLVGPMQNIARTGDVLVTIDTKREPDLALRLLGSEELAKRSTRISAAITPEGEGALTLSSGEVTAVIEGDFPSFLLSVAMRSDPSFSKEKDHYAKGEVNIGSLSSRVVMYTNGNWDEKKQLFAEPVTMDDVTAGRLSQASIALYAVHPTTFFDLGLEIPQTVYPAIEKLMVTIDDDHVATIAITAVDEQKAATLSKLLRSAYVAKLRRDGEKFSLENVRNMFTLEGNLLTMSDMKILDSQFSGMLEELGSLV